MPIPDERVRGALFRSRSDGSLTLPHLLGLPTPLRELLDHFVGAREITDGRNLRPTCCADLRLRTSAMRVSCSTGGSPIAPLVPVDHVRAKAKRIVNIEAIDPAPPATTRSPCRRISAGFCRPALMSRTTVRSMLPIGAFDGGGEPSQVADLAATSSLSALTFARITMRRRKSPRRSRPLLERVIGSAGRASPASTTPDAARRREESRA